MLVNRFVDIEGCHNDFLWFFLSASNGTVECEVIKPFAVTGYYSIRGTRAQTILPQRPWEFDHISESRKPVWRSQSGHREALPHLASGQRLQTSP